MNRRGKLGWAVKLAVAALALAALGGAVFAGSPEANSERPEDQRGRAAGHRERRHDVVRRLPRRPGRPERRSGDRGRGRARPVRLRQADAARGGDAGSDQGAARRRRSSPYTVLLGREHDRRRGRPEPRRGTGPPRSTSRRSSRTPSTTVSTAKDGPRDDRRRQRGRGDRDRRQQRQGPEPVDARLQRPGHRRREPGHRHALDPRVAQDPLPRLGRQHRRLRPQLQLARLGPRPDHGRRRRHSVQSDRPNSCGFNLVVPVRRPGPRHAHDGHDRRRRRRRRHRARARTRSASRRARSGSAAATWTPATAARRPTPSASSSSSRRPNLAGQNADPTKRPHVMNNSWGCPQVGRALRSERDADDRRELRGRRASSSRPPPATTAPPATRSRIRRAPTRPTFSTGAISGTTNALQSFSSRGTVSVDGSQRMKPDISAPGASVRSSPADDGRRRRTEA